MSQLAALPAGRPDRIVYFGTPEIAVPPLEALIANGFEVALVVTGSDKRRGRGGETASNPVKSAAQGRSIAVSHTVADAVDVGADLGVVVAFGQLIKEPVLARLAMVNLHFSLLPRWRGAAPVERAILAGDRMTGVCLIQLDVGLDTGPIVDQVEVSVGSRETADHLRRQLVEVGSELLVRNLAVGLGRPTPQVGAPTYAAKLDPAELEIDWNRPAIELDRLIRLGSAWTTFRGKRLKILAAEPCQTTDTDTGTGTDTGAGTPTDAATARDTATATDTDGVPAGSFTSPVTVGCGRGRLHLGTVQPEGKRAMDAMAWSNGAKPAAGERLGTPRSTIE